MTSLEREFLELTNSVIEEKLSLCSGFGGAQFGQDILKRACLHLCVSSHAKRVRPMLSFYYGLMLEQADIHALSKIGVAAEFIHAASLLHDDVIDDADVRRGKSSVNRVYGNAASVLSGNFLLTLSFELLKDFERSIIDQAISVVNAMTKAAILEINTRACVEVSPEAWTDIAIGKTGALFSWCGFAVGTWAKRPADAQKICDLGRHIGKIFQMADDLKDFHGDQNLKDKCRDIRNKEPSLPIILAIKSDAKIKEEFRQAFLKDHLENHVVVRLENLVYESGAILKTQDLMNREFQALQSGLAFYENSVGKTHIDEWMNELVKTVL